MILCHYVPFAEKESLLKNRIVKIVNERIIEIDNTPLDQPLRQDMMTSCMTANTPRDVSSTVNSADADMLRPMTDQEVFGIILDSMLGGTDTVSKFYF